MVWYGMVWYDIFNCNWVVSTHLQTNNT